MRAYFFGNFYLSSIQQGIQGQHAFGELFNKYDNTETPQQSMLRDFNKNHKTSIYLNGGNQKSLQELHTFFEQAEAQKYNEFPYTQFFEESDALNGCLTSVVIILPTRIYEFAEILKKDVSGIIRTNIQEQLNRKGFASFDLTNPIDVNSMINNRWEFEFSQLLPTFSLAK